MLSTSHRREEEDDDEEKKEDDHHNLRRDHHQNQTASSSISATRHIYPNVLEDGDGENENCAVGVPVLADGSIDFNAYERGGGGGGRERTRRHERLRESVGGERRKPRRFGSVGRSKLECIASIFFSKLCGVAKLFDRFVRLRFGPAELSQELLVRSLGRRRIRQRYRARRVFSDRVEHNHGKFVAE